MIGCQVSYDYLFIGSDIFVVPEIYGNISDTVQKINTFLSIRLDFLNNSDEHSFIIKI